jgi:hypothetical protein
LKIESILVGEFFVGRVRVLIIMGQELVHWNGAISTGRGWTSGWRTRVTASPDVKEVLENSFLVFKREMEQSVALIPSMTLFTEDAERYICRDLLNGTRGWGSGIISVWRWREQRRWLHRVWCEG